MLYLATCVGNLKIVELLLGFRVKGRRSREAIQCCREFHSGDFYPSERSELRYRVKGVPFPVVYPLSPPRGLHWEGFKA